MSNCQSDIFKIYFQYPIVFAKAPKDQTKLEAVGTALSFLDKFLEGQDYVAGNTMTLADLSIVATVSTMEVTCLKILIS